MKLRPSRPTTIALLLSPVGLLLISATRLLIISDYNTSTASTIVSSGSYINTLLGTVVPIVPIFMPYLALILLFLNRVIASALALLAAAFVSPTPTTMPDVIKLVQEKSQLLNNWVQAHTAVVVILGAAFVLFLLAELINSGFYNLLKTIAPVTALALIPLIFRIYPLPLNNNGNYWSDLIRQPWLPAVRITLHYGRPVVGYTLSTKDNWFVVLSAGSRKIRYVHADNVARQRTCQLIEPQVTTPLITLIPVVPTVPMCWEPIRPASSGRKASSKMAPISHSSYGVRIAIRHKHI